MRNIDLTIDQILPHQGRMLLLDELLSHDDVGIVTAVTIHHDTVMCDGVNGVPAWVGMEYMAQAACAYTGVHEVRAGDKPKITLLLGTRSFKAHVPVFPIGSRLIVSAELLMCDDDNLAVFNCCIECNGQEWAVGDIKAIRPADIRVLIQEQLNEQSE
ncbi:MAG: 3-hydroxylacyl-ACP dehydratase [Solimonas sp.]